MSTFDGEQFVQEQVRSILAQSHRELRLLIRDDGSGDNTVELIRSFSDPRVVVLEGENLGLPQAFFRLIDESSCDADYWALSDQDDVWAPDKIASAVAALAPISGPALYCARVMVTDEQLRALYPHELPRRGPSFANALVQNIALGCTIVINRAARELVIRRWPAECVMHDAWLYLVIAGTGTVVYDDALVVQYRQHGANAVGMGSGPLSRLAGRVRRQLGSAGPGKHGRQDHQLLRTHRADLTPTALRQLEEFLGAQSSLGARIRYAVRGPAHRQTLGSDVVLRGLQVLGRV